MIKGTAFKFQDTTSIRIKSSRRKYLVTTDPKELAQALPKPPTRTFPRRPSRGIL